MLLPPLTRRVWIRLGARNPGTSTLGGSTTSSLRPATNVPPALVLSMHQQQLRGASSRSGDGDDASETELDEEWKTAFGDFKIPVVRIDHREERQHVFSCYEDINSGREDLTAQQLRRAAFYGPYIDLLDEFAEDENFKRILGKPKPCAKESDRELVLRALAFVRSGSRFKQPLKHFLNKELEEVGVDLADAVKRDQTLRKLRNTWEFVMKVACDSFTTDDGTICAFRTWTKDVKTGVWSYGDFSKPLWDIKFAVLEEMYTMFPKHQMYTKCKADLQRAVQELYESRRIGEPIRSPKSFDSQKHALKVALMDVMAEANPDPGSRSFPGSEAALCQSLFEKQEQKCPI